MANDEYLKGLKRSWNTYGKEDPLWAIALSPEKKGNRWDEEEFFATGKDVARQMMHWCDTHGLPNTRGTFLDFGCGVGRLTQAFAEHFKKCIGIDIAPSMIRAAKQFNTFGPRVTYTLNEREDLSLFKDGTVDMIYTEHVLQHISPEVSKGYIAEMIRVLKPGGLLSFHIPSVLGHLFTYPESGLSAKITFQGKSLRMEPGATATIPVTVHNTGTVSWLSHTPTGRGKILLRLMNTWYDAGNELLLDGLHHEDIPETIAPAEALVMEYSLTAPGAPGNYLALFDIIDFNGVTFANRGNPLFGIGVEVLPHEDLAARGQDAAGSEPVFHPKMEMHAIPVAEVEALVRACKARLVEVEQTERPPDEHSPARYFITKD
ncbi:MAG: methyltransferase domain-containing protein [Proteobacteria bacterium]|nr:methyltransferase domain-containing protein [Pseudomonadota bacterium]MBU1595997.1 methyltransferase domain-containing protein [Pseudomonadota bacterium]